jgi:hypothetical protein
MIHYTALILDFASSLRSIYYAGRFGNRFHSHPQVVIVLTDASVRVAQLVYRPGYGLDNRGSIPGKDNDGIFFLCHGIQTCSRARQGCYPVSTAGFFSPAKSGRGVKFTTNLRVVSKLRIYGAIPPLSQYVFMAIYLVKHRDNFTLFYTYVFKASFSVFL